MKTKEKIFELITTFDDAAIALTGKTWRLKFAAQIYVSGQVNKSTGRMPWHWEPMKDVTSCEKLR